MKEDLINSYIDDNYVDNNSGYNELTPLIRKIEQEQSIKVQNDKIRKLHEEEEWRRSVEERKRIEEEQNRKKEEERITQLNEKNRKTERKKRIGKILKEGKIKKVEGKTRVLNNFLNDQPIDVNDECYKKIMEPKLRRFLSTERGKQRIYDYKQNKETDVSHLGLYYHHEWKHHGLAESSDINVYKHYKKKYRISIKGINSIENSPRLVLLAQVLKIVLNAWILGILAFAGLSLAIINTFWITCSTSENWSLKLFWFIVIGLSFCIFCCCPILCMTREAPRNNEYFYDPKKSNMIYDPRIKILKSKNIKKIVVMRVVYLFFVLLLITSTIVLSFVQTEGWWCWIMRITNLIIGVIIIFGSTIFSLSAIHPARGSKIYYGIWHLFVLKSSNEDKYYKKVGLLINDDTDINEI